MSPTQKHVVFDIVGTLVSYDRLFNAIDTRLGDRLRAECIKPSLLGYTWIEVAEREYTYLSLSGVYKPFAEVFEAIWYRMLWMAGISKPREFATADDLAFIMTEYQQLEMRPGAAECVQKLRDGGFTVWAFTAADIKRVSGYFAQAGIELPSENLLSCDTEGVGKPTLDAYVPLFNKLKQSSDQVWFAAGHQWDVSAASRVGFKSAYCTIWEQEPLTNLFGEMDVTGVTLPEMADKVVAASSTS
ncbi:hypothetical protein AAFC00_005022 [Neodothiora populina]|uniref:2-haloalkanoic acid dehalogenase n=1 Tax=Neodothiora populina TaxID=2781224 RepID=A0ABR3P450_9PEZI